MRSSGDALVPVGSLDVPLGEDAEHRPQRVGGGQGLVVAGVAEEHRHAAAPVGVGVGRHLGQPGPGPLAVEPGGAEPGLGRLDPEIGEQGRVVDVVQDRALRSAPCRAGEPPGRVTTSPARQAIVPCRPAPSTSVWPRPRRQ